MTTPPAPSASEQTQPPHDAEPLRKCLENLAACIDHGFVREVRQRMFDAVKPAVSALGLDALCRRLDDLEALRCDRTARNVDEWLDGILKRLSLLESAARPAPGISEITSDDLDRAPPSGPAFERFWVGFEGSTFSPQGAAAAAFYAGWRAAVAYASVRERERAATAWPDWMTGYKAKMADEAAQLERERAGKVQDETPTGASTSCPESCECDKVCKLSKPTVAPPAAAPGDEAAREDHLAAVERQRRDLALAAEVVGMDERVRAFIKNRIEAGDAFDATLVAFAREEVQLDRSRFPRPADNTERESVKVLRDIQWCAGDRADRCPVCGAGLSREHYPGCRLAAVLGKGEATNGA